MKKKVELTQNFNTQSNYLNFGTYFSRLWGGYIHMVIKLSLTNT